MNARLTENSLCKTFFITKQRYKKLKYELFFYTSVNTIVLFYCNKKLEAKPLKLMVELKNV